MLCFVFGVCSGLIVARCMDYLLVFELYSNLSVS